MEVETMAILTGLLSVGLGTVLIGGALLCAWLLGRERGRRELRGGESAAGYSAPPDDIKRLNERYDEMRVSLERLNAEHRAAMQILAAQAPASRVPSPGSTT